MQVKNLIFDLGNVIVDLDFNRCESLLRPLTGISWANAQQDDLQIFMDFECGRIPEDIFLNYLIKKSPHRVQAIDLIHAWNAMLVDIPLQRLLMLKRLMKDYKVLLLSNTNETHIRWVRSFLKQNYNLNGLEDVVHQAFYSHELHCRKPEEEIYLKLLETADIRATDCLFFDDNEDNIVAARQLDFRSILVDPDDEIIDIVPLVLKELHAQT